jgi:hypothetical protein
MFPAFRRRVWGAAHFMSKDGCNGSGPEFGAGIKCAIEKGWLELAARKRVLCAAADAGRGFAGEGMTYSAAFDAPIVLPDGREIVTLLDAGEYITSLPKKEHAAPEWQAAMEALILVAEGVFARIGIMRALNRHYVPELNPKGKEPHWGRRKLKRINGRLPLRQELP